jgi:hypothetical protein
MYELDDEGKETERDVMAWEDASDSSNGRISPDLGARIKRLFESEAIQKAYARRSEYWILDGCGWYMANILRVTDESWTPTDDDCMMSRVRTTGIIVTDLCEKVDKEAADEKHAARMDAASSVGPQSAAAAPTEADVSAPDTITWQIVDVGGQRNERKKWIHTFDDVCTPLSFDSFSRRLTHVLVARCRAVVTCCAALRCTGEGDSVCGQSGGLQRVYVRGPVEEPNGRIAGAV